MNYHPRPFSQGYVAYTKDFLHRNGNFYAHPQSAPSFVIFGTTPTDIRFPTMEDSQALQVILRDYQPIDYEKDLWLLKRRPRSPSIYSSSSLDSTNSSRGQNQFAKSQSQNTFIKLRYSKVFLGTAHDILLPTPTYLYRN